MDRWPISNYDVNDRNEVRRAYIQRGPYQPPHDTYPQTILSGYARRFNKSCEIASHYGGDTFISKGLRLGIISKDLINILGNRIDYLFEVMMKVKHLVRKLSLSPSHIRGQGYDGASNMRGHINGLRTLIQKDYSFAHYVHYFAHQLQLTLVKVAHKHVDVQRLIDLTNLVLNTIVVSYKRRDEFRQKQAEMVEKALSEVAGDDDIARTQAILDGIQIFDFAFMIYLMKLVLGISNELSLSLQRRDHDVVNAMSLLSTTKSDFRRLGMKDGNL
ncbi:uncharacterized protein LOC130810115 [Amaranthus tricolor]|uniref:uncharacterized protein LOC130810115 n=1 Tax=Amaranthus tricolor TaxID=29722 RepID=UPI0025888CB2|nr:uncharacterized protein LOC130810115 [Amaranthus tricolor]